MPLSFKDFIVVDYTQDGDEQSAYNSVKRKRHEALSHAQRIKAKLRMKKIKQKIKIGRERAARKTPNMEVVKKRARKQARTMLLKRLTKGQDKGDISFARRQDLEKRLDKMQPKINAIAKRLIPQVRKQDRERKQAKANQ